MTDELVLRWAGGELNLMGWNDGPDGPYKIEALPSGTDWGNPVPMRRALRRFLSDGSVSVKEYDDNRTIPLALRVSAPDGQALASAEIPLALADTRRCELVWTPKDTRAAAAVFVATAVDLTRRKATDAGDPLGEARRRRYYTLTLDCLPYAFSDEYVDVEAVAQSVSTPTVVDDCSSVTAWQTINADRSVISSGGDASVIKVLRDAPGLIVVTRAGTVDFSTQPYLAVKVNPTPPAGPLPSGYKAMEVRAVGTHTWLSVPAAGTDAGRVLYNVGAVATSVNAMRFTYTEAQGEVRFFQLEKQATARSVASRQQVRMAEIPGSRRTSGSLLIESPTTGLGTTLVYTGPSYDPTWSRGDLATRATRSDNLSGGLSLVSIGGSGNPLRFQRPIADIPSGSHAIWARLFNDAPGTLTITAELRAASDSALLTSTTLMAVPLGLTGYRVVPLGVAELPGFLVPPGSTAQLRLVCSWDNEGAEFGIDELLTFQLDDGSLTVAEAGTNRSLWLDAPSLESDTPAAYVGTGAKVEARPMSLISELPSWPGSHTLTPPTVHAYVGTLGASDAGVSWSARPAWAHYPGVLQTS